HGWLLRIQYSLHTDRQRRKKVEARHAAELKQQAPSEQQSREKRKVMMRREMMELMDLFKEQHLSPQLWNFVQAGNEAHWDYEKIAEALGMELHYVRRTMQRLKQWVLARQPDGMGRCALAGALVVMAWCASHPDRTPRNPHP